jgi:hypothetical protein
MLVDLNSVKTYPGSSKGPHPNDDPEYFADWYVNNLNPEMKAAYQSISPSDAGLPETEEGKYTTNKIDLSSEHILNTTIANHEIALTRPEDRITLEPVDLTFSSGARAGETNPLPDNLTNDDHNNQFLIEQWAMFRIFPVMVNFFGNFDKLVAHMQTIQGQQKVLPTLMRYYNLLPEFARNAPYVRNAVRGLEFYKHSVPLEEKELWLNYVCQFALPREECKANDFSK